MSVPRQAGWRLDRISHGRRTRLGSQLAEPIWRQQVRETAPRPDLPWGGELGCNYQTGMFLLGGEADIEYTGINVTRNVVSPIFGVPISESTISNWLSTYRGRLGIASGVWLFYATGGLALGQFNIADTATFAGSGTVNTITTTNTKLGWTVGGGAEWMFAPQWSLKAEYLYVDLGSETATSVNNNPALFPSSSIIHTHSLTENIGRVGVNFHF